MCRWLAYSGSPLALDTFLLEPEHSLIDQSLHARMGVTTTNGDGFGVGWYGDGPGAHPLSFDHTGMERSKPARAGGARQVGIVSRAHPRVDRHGRTADQLPPVSP